MENSLQRSPKISKLTCGVCSNVGGEDGDRLSNLPEPIVHHIFSFLETIDVVRASAVSQKWRWIAVVARRNVQVLDLHIISDEPIKLPRSLVTCESLVSLKLDFGNREHQGVLNLPTCAGFSRLKSLDLQHVEVLNYNLFREFLSSCPLLENLYMKECFFHDFEILDISTTSLKYLTVDEFLLSEPKGLRSCKVICESLEALKLHFGREIDKCVLKLPPTCVGFSRLKSLDLKNVKLLDHSFFLKLISSSPLLENLKMDSCCLPDLKILDISSNSLKSLSTLSLVVMNWTTTSLRLLAQILSLSIFLLHSYLTSPWRA